ncbi:hypothetical protein V502_05460 [Pseudogymnoascus sp. VKM F-4520 (FW-2644)]|nr:hypothetical protein V502_05460 [Pseudogymnoascus sp. VKM F-4520 (FW-2644)]
MPSEVGAELLITAHPAGRRSASTPTPTSTAPRWDGRLTGWQGSDVRTSLHAPNYSIVYSSPIAAAPTQIQPHQRLPPTSRYGWKPLVLEERLSEPGVARSDAASVCASLIPAGGTRDSCIAMRSFYVPETQPPPAHGQAEMIRIPRIGKLTASPAPVSPVLASSCWLFFRQICDEARDTTAAYKRTS